MENSFYVIALHCLLMIPALILVHRDPLSSKSQKGYQTLFAVVVPVIGPVIILIVSFYMKARPSARKSDVGDSAADHVRKHGHRIP